MPASVIWESKSKGYASILKQSRKEAPDQHESSKEHLKQAEAAYLELTEIYNYIKIDCVKDDVIRTIDDINKEVVEKIEGVINVR